MSRIYVASLSDYNAGILHGMWYDLEDFDDVDDVHAAIRAMLSLSPTALAERNPAEEWAIHDYEGFAGFKIGEYELLEGVYALSEVIEDLDADAVPFALWAENQGFDADDAADKVDDFREAFAGEQTALDYAYDYVDDCVFDDKTPDILKQYFDYEAFARDLLMSDMYELSEDFGPTYLFHSY